MYHQLEQVKGKGFSGFKTVAQLWQDHSVLTKDPGVYLILHPDCSKNQLIPKGPGGFFKQRDPNVDIAKLSARWISNCHLQYIGQAGAGVNSTATLNSRLKQYLDFGKGLPVGHYGGRYIWQLKHHPELLVAWKATPNLNPRTEEKRLIAEFEQFYGKLPFANINH